MNLKPEQEVALKALAEGKTREEAAIEAGVSERTIYYWLSDGMFKEGIRQEQRDRWNRLMSILLDASIAATRYLGEVIEGRNDVDHLRVRAAGICLSNSVNLNRIMETANVKKELDELKAVLKLR